MWNVLVRVILRYRLANLIIIGLITVFLGYKAMNVSLSYEMAKMLPSSDSTAIEYEEFKNVFGEDGNIFFVGIQDKKIFQLPAYRGLYELGEELRKTEGVEEVLSIARVFYLDKDTSKKKFIFRSLVDEKPKTQEELDSIKKALYAIEIYGGLLYNEETDANLMMITLDKDKVNSKNRIKLIEVLKQKLEAFGKEHNIKLHYSGLPYIRTITTKKVRDELKLFVILAMAIASLALFLFFRSFKAVLFPMIIVLVALVWVMGMIELLNYKITILNGIIPPLLIVIVVENCIFLLNKYHVEYRNHGNKVKALSRVVQRIGNATLMTNATTAIGFATFIITFNDILVEFGIIASISIMMGYLLTLFMIPITFSYIDPPKTRHTKHLENKTVNKIVSNVVHSVLYKKKLNFSIAFILIIVGIIGATKLNRSGKVVDDIPKNDPLYVDLEFFEEHFKGIMPLEISIDTKRKNGVLRLSTLRKIDRLQEELGSYDELSRPLSVTEVVKAAKQAFYNGNQNRYSLPNNMEKSFILSYVPTQQDSAYKNSILNSFIDSNQQIARVSVQIKNIGTEDIKAIKDSLQPKIDSIFNKKNYDVKITGTSVVFLKGSDFLIKNLKVSLSFAVIIISLIMALLFTSARMVFITIITNLFPLLITAGMMGYLQIPIKPSTILIFSIAFGILVNNAIHFLAKYRQELKIRDWNIKESCIYALRETSVSMMYSSVVLFFGFAIFIFSSFGGTQALGMLISFTLLIAFFSNIIILPSLLLVLKRITDKSFKKPVFKSIALYDENIEYKERKYMVSKDKFLKRFKRFKQKKQGS